MLNWTPTDGETVHINHRNTWGLNPGRYQLRADTRRKGCWYLEGLSVAGWLHTHGADLRLQEQGYILTPIGNDELERERQRVALLSRAPLRRAVPQHDASGLDLFRAANEPRLI